jgi:hypothetical protein
MAVNGWCPWRDVFIFMIKEMRPRSRPSSPSPAPGRPRRRRASPGGKLGDAQTPKGDEAWMYTVTGKKVSRAVTGVDKLGRLRLFQRDDVWKHLAFNKHVHSGYRQALTPAQCLRSMFQIHNETGNIWSHFSVIFFFLYRLAFLKVL